VSTLPVHELNTSANELNLGSAKVYHLPDWHKLSHPERLGVMRQIAKMRGRDPRIAKLALSIIRRSGAKPRQYEKQASALLKWVQNPKNCYYINEPGERLQDPIYTIKPWKQVLSGQGPKGKIRYIEGERVPSGVAWTHIYCMVGTPPFQPNRWYFCEPTVQGVPLGWDVISGDHRFLPEMVKRKRGGPQVVMPSPSAPLFHRPPKMPAMKNRSPAYDAAYGGIPNPGGIGGAIGGSVAAEIEDRGFNWKGVLLGVATGVVIGVTTTVVLDTLRSQEWYPRPRPMGAA
jgi:hypothetical protein